jgi:ribosomal protein S18 acetylase RimI-like enzyme
MAVLEATITLAMPITLRLATEADLPKLEWYGQYIHYRNLFRRAFIEQQQGRRRMLVADCNGFPIGYIFVLMKSANMIIADGWERAYLYSLRVMEMFQGKGIGTQLILEAESIVRDRAFSWTTIAVAKDNHKALCLYERLGYRIFGEDAGRWSFLDHRGRTRYVDEPSWVLEKQL